MELVAGIDSSTQSTKVVLRAIDSGEVVAQASAPHPQTTPPVSEQDPSRWWSALTDAFAKLEADLRGAVEALSIGGQQHGLVLLDDTGAVIRPAKLWNDTTSAPQARELTDREGAPYWAERCGTVPLAAITISKLAWVIGNEPESAARVDKVMLPHDYLTWRLTGQHVTDRGDASGTGWFDPTSDTYQPDLLDHVDPGRGQYWAERMPRLVAHHDPAGTLSPEAALALGLRAGIPVGPGTGDNMAAALGLGLAPGDTAISLGTSGTVYATSLTPTNDPTGIIAGFADATGRFLPLICTLNATKVTNAVAHWFNTSPEQLGHLASQALDDEPDQMPILVPYFDGERTPNLPHSAGQWFGLRTSTTQAQLALSAFDGVLCNLLEGFDALEQAGVPTQGRVFLLGGGSRSAIYRSRAATLLGRPITVPDDDELVAAGAASQAASILTKTSLADIADRWHLGSGTVTEPQPGAGSIIRHRYRQAAVEVARAADR